MTIPPETAIDVLLAAAGITVSPQEYQEFVAAYPAHRAQLDSLYDVSMDHEEEPQLVFSPLP
jgi:hypothetical protein